jgi:ATP-binding protein involved in chromosome partitioning
MSMNPFDKQSPITGVKKIILVGSGKGGVGKSTVAANLALAMSRQDLKVGLLDADVYGPSVPRLFGVTNGQLNVNKDGKIEPIVRHGVKLMSIGFLVAEGSAVVWRGPMLFKAMDQFFRDVLWADLDCLIVDLPPGTGDVALTVAQKVPVAGAVVVTTPQNLSLVDARKAIDMFERINVPVLGAIENMSFFKASADAEPVQLFPRGDLDQFLDSKGIVKLATLPFDPKVGLACEAGFPTVVSDENGAVSECFAQLAKQLIART